jgi:hypothetical protein
VATDSGYDFKVSGLDSFCLYLKWRKKLTFIDEGIPSFTTTKQNYIITKVKVNSKSNITVVSAEYGSNSQAEQ